VQDLALGLVETHMTDLGPSIQPVQIPLQSLPALKQTDTLTQPGVICKHSSLQLVETINLQFLIFKYTTKFIVVQPKY